MNYVLFLDVFVPRKIVLSALSIKFPSLRIIILLDQILELIHTHTHAHISLKSSLPLIPSDEVPI